MFLKKHFKYNKEKLSTTIPHLCINQQKLETPLKFFYNKELTNSHFKNNFLFTVLNKLSTTSPLYEIIIENKPIFGLPHPVIYPSNLPIVIPIPSFLGKDCR